MKFSYEKVRARMATSAGSELVEAPIFRRVGIDNDVKIRIKYCGVCHTDLHLVNDDWGISNYPLVPGHEIVGEVIGIGAKVQEFKVGDIVGVGPFVNSCNSCGNCKDKREQYCEVGVTDTYNAVDPIDGSITLGGFSDVIVVDQRFVLRIPELLDPAQAAPLLCAGVTVFNPLRKHNVGVGKHVAVLGMGGLGHLGLQIAKAMGAEVSLITRSRDKAQEARNYGADSVVVSEADNGLASNKNRFDLILDTAPVNHNINPYLPWLSIGGTYVVVGQLTPLQEGLDIRTLILGGRSIEGSLVGSVQDTQDALDFCTAHGVSCEIEILKFKDVNLALSRLKAGEAKYRFVLDMMVS